MEGYAVESKVSGDELVSQIAQLRTVFSQLTLSGDPACRTARTLNTRLQGGETHCTGISCR